MMKQAQLLIVCAAFVFVGWQTATASSLGSPQLVAQASSGSGSSGDLKVSDGKLQLPAPITFEAGSDALSAGAKAALQGVKAYLQEKTYISTLRIEGHVAPSGDAAKDQTLSEKRALAISRWLVSQGIDCSRLLAVGFGSTKPVADGSTAEGRAANTRIEFVNAALKGMAIGGMPLDGGGNIAGDVCKK